jgi:hypothetical protein
LGGDSYPQLRGNGSYLIMGGGDDTTSGSVVCDSVLNAFRRESANTSLGSSSYRWSNVFSEQGNFSGQVNIRKDDAYANESDCMSNAKLIIGPYDTGAFSLLFTRNSI